MESNFWLRNPVGRRPNGGASGGLFLILKEEHPRRLKPTNTHDSYFDAFTQLAQFSRPVTTRY
ncbi:MAG TPA: hypothetical protein VIJ75_06065 [Hanamia sp.]